MKIFFVAIVTICLLAGRASAQQVIRAKEAYKHVGQQVTVRDSVYHGQVYDDSTLVVELGNRRLIAPLSVVFSAGKNPKLAEPNYVANYLQKGPVIITGQVLMIKGHPTIIVTDWNALKFER